MVKNKSINKKKIRLSNWQHFIRDYNFSMPDFTRVAWVSDKAKNVWRQRISMILQMWTMLERISILAKIRKCALITIDAEEFLSIGDWCIKNNIGFLPLTKQAAITSSYSAVGRPPEQGENFNFRVVLGQSSELLRFRKAWGKKDDSKMGELLGYPSCCRAFFREVWNNKGWIDTTWPMACGTSGAQVSSENLIEVNGHPYSNILLRWLGVRAVPHLPCSFNCKATVSFGDKMLTLAEKSGYNKEVDWLREMLDWPMEWSALNGIAEIRTPVVKILTATFPNPKKVIVHRKGSVYPSEGAKGLHFPYHISNADIDKLQRDNTNIEDWYYLDNGFSSMQAMYNAHKPVVNLASNVLQEIKGEVKILDLGCGNAALLKNISNIVNHCTPFGVDIEAKKINNAKQLLPAYKENFYCGNIFDTEMQWFNGTTYDLVILMPGRLLECSPEQAKQLRHYIATHASKLLIYTYSDVQENYGNLGALAKKTGLNVLNEQKNSLACLAEINGKIEKEATL